MGREEGETASLDWTSVKSGNDLRVKVRVISSLEDSTERILKDDKQSTLKVIVPGHTDITLTFGSNGDDGAFSLVNPDLIPLKTNVTFRYPDAGSEKIFAQGSSINITAEEFNISVGGRTRVDR